MNFERKELDEHFPFLFPKLIHTTHWKYDYIIFESRLAKKTSILLIIIMKFSGNISFGRCFGHGFCLLLLILKIEFCQRRLLPLDW